jgi:hypothetical protein
VSARRLAPTPRFLVAGLVAAAAAAGACRSQAKQTAAPAEHNVVWRPLGSWSGHGSLQTESFTSETGTLRIRWEAAREAGSVPGPAVSDGAAFRLTAHSAISGRVLQQVVDHPGPGNGTGYVQQDPHVFYMVVESSQVNWKFTVEEAIGYP